jgi:hypothetical protein
LSRPSARSLGASGAKEADGRESPVMTPIDASTRAERALLIRVNEQNFRAMNNDDRRGRMSSYFNFVQVTLLEIAENTCCDLHILS